MYCYFCSTGLLLVFIVFDQFLRTCLHVQLWEFVKWEFFDDGDYLWFAQAYCQLSGLVTNYMLRALSLASCVVWRSLTCRCVLCYQYCVWSHCWRISCQFSRAVSTSWRCRPRGYRRSERLRESQTCKSTHCLSSGAWFSKKSYDELTKNLWKSLTYEKLRMSMWLSKNLTKIL